MNFEKIITGIFLTGVFISSGCSYEKIVPRGERAADICSEQGINPGTPEWYKCLQKNNHPRYDKDRGLLR